MSSERHPHAEQNPDAKSDEQKGRSIAEWTTLAISTAILVSIIGAITWLSFVGSEHPARIVVEPHIDRMREEETGYYVPVTVRNEGDTTVSDAIIQGELDTGVGQPETVDITISFLAGGEQINGTMVFQSDPTQGELTTGVTSYMEP